MLDETDSREKPLVSGPGQDKTRRRLKLAWFLRGLRFSIWLGLPLAIIRDPIGDQASYLLAFWLWEEGRRGAIISLLR